MKKHILTAALLTTLFFITCNLSDKKEKEESKPTEEQIRNDTMAAIPHDTTIVGNDRDEHGCIGSAGYTWSEIKNSCVRLFEDADLNLLPSVKPANQTSTVAIIFDDQKTKAEVFIPEMKAMLLSKKSDKLWTNDNYELRENKGYKLFENGKETYHK